MSITARIPIWGVVFAFCVALAAPRARAVQGAEPPPPSGDEPRAPSGDEPPAPGGAEPLPPDAEAAAAVGAEAGLEAQAEAEAPEIRFFGEWRYIYSHVQDFPLNAAGDTSGLNWYLDQRLDIGVDQPINPSVRFFAELELFYGQVDGELDTLAADYRVDARQTLRGWDLKNAELRQLFVTWQTDWFQLRAGQMGSHWGLGVLANDGRPTPGRFGFQDQGDLSDRVLLATRPLAGVYPDSWPGQLVTALGGGLVYRDENNSLRDGDTAGEALLTVFYPGEELWLGLYVAGRFAEDEPGTRLDVAAFDLYGSFEPPAGRGGPLAAVELVYLAGKTDRLITAERTDGLNVSAFGAVARAGWQFELWGLRPELEVGFASGDPDPHDGTITAFSFDPDYKVGLVLFDALLREVSAMDAQQASDPERVGTALPGTDLLATRGRVTNAVYLNPTVRLRPLEQLTLLAGFLWAFSVVDFAQSYQTFANGGVPTNLYGRSGAGHDLGWELDVGLDWDQPVWRDLALVAGLQAGWYFPGSALERPDGSRPGVVARLISRLALTW